MLKKLHGNSNGGKVINENGTQNQIIKECNRISLIDVLIDNKYLVYDA